METDHLQSVLDDAVAVQPTASATGEGIRQELDALTPSDSAGAAPRDRKGEPHDASRHISPPELTARGTWRKLRGATTADSMRQADGAAVDDFDAAAQQTCELGFGMGAPALSQFLPLKPPAQWEPSDAERDSIQRALSRFYAAHPEWMVDLPPGVSLLLAVGMYALPRVMALPQAQGALSRWMGNGATEPAQQPGVTALGDFAEAA